MKIPNPANENAKIQKDILLKLLHFNKDLIKILTVAETELPYPWYLVGTSISKSVWNYYSDLKINYNIGDYDLIYYADKLSETEEQKLAQKISLKINSSIDLDITNVAKVHIWLRKNMGKNINKYKTLEEDIDSFGQTVSAVAITKSNGTYKIYAPYGLQDIFLFQVHPIKKVFTKDEYMEKTAKWVKSWDLKIFPWL